MACLLASIATFGFASHCCLSQYVLPPSPRFQFSTTPTHPRQFQSRVGLNPSLQITLRNQWQTGTNRGRCGLSLDHSGNLGHNAMPLRLIVVPPHHPNSGPRRFYLLSDSGQMVGFKVGLQLIPIFTTIATSLYTGLGPVCT